MKKEKIRFKIETDLTEYVLYIWNNDRWELLDRSAFKFILKIESLIAAIIIKHYKKREKSKEFEL